MKNLKEILEEIKNAKLILVCGKESSGKTHAIKELIRELSLHNTILVLSNHKEIKGAAYKPENVDSLYKPKDCITVDLKYLESDDDYIFIDEFCENKEEIINNIKNKLIFVQTIKENEDLKDYNKTYDLVIEVSKDNLGTPLFLNSYHN